MIGRKRNMDATLNYSMPDSEECQKEDLRAHHKPDYLTAREYNNQDTRNRLPISSPGDSILTMKSSARKPSVSKKSVPVVSSEEDIREMFQQFYQNHQTYQASLQQETKTNTRSKTPGGQSSKVSKSRHGWVPRQ